MIMNNRQLNFQEIATIGLGFFAIQFVFGLLIVCMSQLLLSFGANTENLSAFWIIIPLSSFMIAPIFGLRKPPHWKALQDQKQSFILVTIIVALCLVALPFATSFGLLLALFFVLFLGLNYVAQPFNTLLYDNLQQEKQSLGFSHTRYYIGLGAIISSLLPWFLANVAHLDSSSQQLIPENVQWSLYITALVFGLCMLYSLNQTAKQLNPEQMQWMDAQEDRWQKGRLDDRLEVKQEEQSRLTSYGWFLLIIAVVLMGVTTYFNLSYALIILVLLCLSIGSLFLLAANNLKNNTHKRMDNWVIDFFNMPKIMKHLAGIQFFTWFGFSLFFIYFIEIIYQSITPSNGIVAQINNAGEGVSFSLSFFNLMAACFLFITPIMVKKMQAKYTLFIALIVGAVCFGLLVWSNVYFHWPMIGVALAWTGILTIPRGILFSNLSTEKMAYYVGNYNVYIILAQAFACSLGGLFVATILKGQVTQLLYIASFALFVAALLSLSLKTKN